MLIRISMLGVLGLALPQVSFMSLERTTAVTINICTMRNSVWEHESEHLINNSKLLKYASLMSVPRLKA